ncbi:hypothetical protein FQR65_LT11621 [Abscondita terminalis]|nr:hypothetical protein FQR65_LT11621 [Abscondita terminalis]
MPKLNKPPEDDEYYRTGKEAGLIVIFNHYSYLNNSSEKREGTNRDVNELILTFGRLGFNIDQNHIFIDKTRGEMIDEITNLAKQDHSDKNCLIVIVLSHGHEDNHIEAFDAPVFANEIWEPFFDNACPSLRGKPKFFIFQTCKGHNVATSDESVGKIVPDIILKEQLDSDVLIAFASIESAVSLRHPTRGSWFIQELCKNFSAYGRRDDVVTLLLRVSKCVTHNYYHVDDVKDKKNVLIKQMPVIVSTLSKKFYLSKSKDRKAMINIREQQQKLLETVTDFCSNNN